LGLLVLYLSAMVPVVASQWFNVDRHSLMRAARGRALAERLTKGNRR
jgi:hypothetical protein